MLSIQVKRTQFSPSSSTGDNNPNTDNVTTASLHISGPVVEENQHVKMGAYHTLDIEVHRDLSIQKENWDSVALERVEESCVPGRGAEVGAVVCGEGTAAFCLLSQHMTVIRQRIEVPIPRKSSSSSAHDKGLEKFYQAVYAGFLRHIPYASTSMRAIVIASPGWVRDAVFDYIIKEATRTGNKALLTSRNKFIKVHITSPHVHSLVEVLKSPEVSTAAAICRNKQESSWSCVGRGSIEGD
jgi:protein pelota